MRTVYKRIGETPLECLRRVCGTGGRYAYAGRLDPMADGLLLILENEECGNASDYYALEKTYRYECVVGIGTDTYDCLGRITKTRPVAEPVEKKITDAVRSLNGTIRIPYPPYSSKTINGAPMFTLARSGTLREKSVPEKTVTIHGHNAESFGPADTRTVRKEAVCRIRKVTGDFRQRDILGDWRHLPDIPLRRFTASLRCSGGTYVRALANLIGGMIGYPVIAARITRTGIGPWTERDIQGQYPSADG